MVGTSHTSIDAAVALANEMDPGERAQFVNILESAGKLVTAAIIRNEVRWPHNP